MSTAGIERPGQRRRVVGSEGVGLAVTEYGVPTAAVHVVLVHGFPDDQTMWADVITHLPADWHLVTYDVRGAGASDRPADVAAYRTEHLVEDFTRVLEETVPDDAAVHLVAHDWGSIAGWHVIAAEGDDPRLHGRIASYTSASGPSLDHLGTVWHSWPGRRRLLRQVLHSWYVWLFQVPVIPDLMWRHLQRALKPVVTRIDPTMADLPWGRTLAHNAVPSIHLYRANVLRILRHPQQWRTNVPVRLLIAKRDGYVTPRSVEGMQARCRRLTRVDLDAGHWHPRTDPAAMAAQIVTAVRSTTPPSR